MNDPDDHAGLTPAEAARFDGIVHQEWPEDAHDGATRPTFKFTYSSESAQDDAPTIVTLYRPLRPSVLPALLAVVCLAATTAITVIWALPLYRRASAVPLSRATRLDVSRDLEAIGITIGLGLTLAVTLAGVWVTRWAVYRLRRSAFRMTSSRCAPAKSIRITPPNPATALAWIGLLVSATAAAGLFAEHLLGQVAAGDVIGPTRSTVKPLVEVGSAWCLVLIVAAIGLGAWAARQGRHRLRVLANDESLKYVARR